MPRPRSNAIIGRPQPRTRSRRGAISHGSAPVFEDPKLSQYTGAAVHTPTLGKSLVGLQIEAMRRSAEVLGACTVNYEQMAWDTVKASASIASDQIFGDDDDPQSVREALSGSIGDTLFDAPEIVSELGGSLIEKGKKKIPRSVRRMAAFLKKLWEKARDKIMSHPILSRLAKLAGVGMVFLLGWVKKVILSLDLLKALVPFYGPIKSLIDTAIAAKGAWEVATVVDKIKAASSSIGSGVPTIALNAFRDFVNRDKQIAVGSTVWTAVKGLASVLLTIFTMGLSSVVELVTQCVEAVVSTAYRLFQAITFDKAAGKIQDKVQTGSVGLVHLHMSDICGGCPYMGALYFAGADYIGKDALVALIGTEKFITADAMTANRTVISALKTQAQEYLKAGRFELKWRGGAEIPDDLRLALEPVVG